MKIIKVPGNGNRKHLRILQTKEQKNIAICNPLSPANKRNDYKIIHAQIENSILQFFAQNRRLPTNGEIAEEIGKTRKTVTRHIKQINLNTYLPRLSSLTPMILQRYAAKMMSKPTAKDIEVWMRLVEGVSLK